MLQISDRWQLNTPVAFLIFNRPDTTTQVFEAIRQAKPPILLIVADGPRCDRPTEWERCAGVRAIVEKVDWECEVYKNYSDINLGCKKRVSSGLDWVFSIVEKAIILEDDCLPHSSFFQFCSVLLEYYQNDTRIMMISGDNFQPQPMNISDSYYFSQYSHIWGWATWRRAWKKFDISMHTWEICRNKKLLKNIFTTNSTYLYWTNQLELVRNNKINSWGYIWSYTCFINNGLTIIPIVNLVKNIGFGDDSTHTIDANHELSELETRPIAFPLQHPKFIFRSLIEDNLTERNQFSYSFLGLIKLKIKKIFGA